MLRMDVASLLMHRDDVARRGPFLRFNVYDSSPQHGLEIFCISEDRSRVSDVAGKSIEQIDPKHIEQYLMPSVTMSQGRAGELDKTMCYVHQCWLTYASAESSLRSSSDDVFSVCSDSGVDRRIGEAVNAIDMYYAHRADDSDHSPCAESRLLRFAIRTPGVMHINDWVLQKSLKMFDFWDATSNQQGR